jgi:hypothetical protein
VTEADPEVVRIGGLQVSLERMTYATVVLMSVLVVYDGWEQLATFIGVAAVILGPILALAVAHFFSEILQAYAEHQRPLTFPELRWHARDQVQTLLAAVPPLIVLGLGWISPLDARGTIELLLWTGMVTLIGLASIAGRRAGLRGLRWFVISLSGGVVGLIVISLQIILKPH